MSLAINDKMFREFSDAKEYLNSHGPSVEFSNFLLGFKRTEYSMNNKLLLFLQKQDATEVYGYRTRLTKGRAVKKGQKSLIVFAVNQRELEDEKGNIKKKTYFGTKPVFDISQTEPIKKPS